MRKNRHAPDSFSSSTDDAGNWALGQGRGWPVASTARTSADRPSASKARTEKALPAADAAIERGCGAGRLSRFQPPDFRLELEAQLRGLVFRQPVRHLRKDGAPVKRAARVPGKALRRARPGRARAAVRRAPRPDRRDTPPATLRGAEAPAGFRRTDLVERGASWRLDRLSFRSKSACRLCQRTRAMATVRRPFSPTSVCYRRSRRAAPPRCGPADRLAAAQAQPAGRGR